MLLLWLAAEGRARRGAVIANGHGHCLCIAPCSKPRKAPQKRQGFPTLIAANDIAVTKEEHEAC